MNTLASILLLSALVTVTYATGTECYICSSSDEVCGDEYTGNTDHVTNCSSSVFTTEDGGCSKDKSKIKLFGIWVTTTTRTCGQSNDNSACENDDRVKINILGIQSETWSCSCEGALCNAGSQTMLSTSLLLAAIMKLVL